METKDAKGLKGNTLAHSGEYLQSKANSHNRAAVTENKAHDGSLIELEGIKTNPMLSANEREEDLASEENLVPDMEEEVKEVSGRKTEDNYVFTVMPSRNPLKGNYESINERSSGNPASNKSMLKSVPMRSNTIGLQSPTNKEGGDSHYIGLIKKNKFKIKIVRNENAVDELGRRCDQVSLKRHRQVIEPELSTLNPEELRKEFTAIDDDALRDKFLPKIRLLKKQRKAAKRFFKINKNASRFMRINYTPDFVRQLELSKEANADFKCPRCRKRFDGSYNTHSVHSSIAISCFARGSSLVMAP